MTASTYVFDNAWTEEYQRLSLLEQGWDSITTSQLEAHGVGEGWHCLEVGAGGGSVAGWLCDRVGPEGKVVATDLDPRFLSRLTHSNLQVIEHDIVRDGIAAGAFDLVHARLLLEHLPQSGIAMAKMVQAVKPGGWLFLEEFDHVTFGPDPSSAPEFLDAWSRFAAAFDSLSGQRGLDLSYGSRLPGLLAQHGLEAISAPGTTQAQTGGSPLSEVLALSALKMSPALVTTGKVDATGIERFVALLRDPASRWMSQLMVSAWGKRPER